MGPQGTVGEALDVKLERSVWCGTHPNGRWEPLAEGGGRGRMGTASVPMWNGEEERKGGAKREEQQIESLGERQVVGQPSC